MSNFVEHTKKQMVILTEKATQYSSTKRLKITKNNHENTKKSRRFGIFYYNTFRLENQAGGDIL